MTNDAFPLILLSALRRRRPSASVRQRRRRGVAALEFALIMPIFALFVGMILEVGILLFQQAVLDNATVRAARLIRTGQIQLGGGDASQFTAQLCTGLGTLIPCTGIQYKVTSAATFSALSSAVSSDGQGNLTGNHTFSPGTKGQDVLVQIAWNRPNIVPWIGFLTNGSGSSLMVSMLAFRNELYN